jgi:hypothetical protein
LLHHLSVSIAVHINAYGLSPHKLADVSLRGFVLRVNFCKLNEVLCGADIVGIRLKCFYTLNNVPSEFRQSTCTVAMANASEEHFARNRTKKLRLFWLITHPEFCRRGVATMLCNTGREEAIKRSWV